MYYFIGAFALSFLTNILVIYLSHNHRLFIDHGEHEKPQGFHEEDTPRAGGIGIFVSLFLILFTPFGLRLICPIVIAFASGIFEDFHNALSPKTRLLIQTIAAICVVALADAVARYIGLNIELPYMLGAVISVVAIVGMMNAINMIDGFNGLAGGAVLMEFGSFYYIAYRLQLEGLSTIISISIAAVLGFFVLNFPKGKIFLGDGGAYLLGFLAAVYGIYLAGNYTRVSVWYVVAVLIYPIWEVAFSIIRKTSWGQSPLKPDQYHFHMLVYRQFTKNNPLTALVINIIYAPFIMFATMHHDESITNVTIAVLFILFYTMLYIYLLGQDKTETAI